MPKFNRGEVDRAMSRAWRPELGRYTDEDVRLICNYTRALEQLLNEQFDQPDDDWGLSIFEKE